MKTLTAASILLASLVAVNASANERDTYSACELIGKEWASMNPAFDYKEVWTSINLEGSTVWYCLILTTEYSVHYSRHQDIEVQYNTESGVFSAKRI